MILTAIRSPNWPVNFVPMELFTSPSIASPTSWYIPTESDYKTEHDLCKRTKFKKNSDNVCNMLDADLRSLTSTGIAILSRTAMASSRALLYAETKKQ